MAKVKELVEAIYANNKAKFISLIESNPDLPKELAIAIEENSENWVEYRYGVSPIHFVAANGDEEILKKLVQHMPNLCQLKGRDDHRTPLHWAASTGRIDNMLIILLACPEAIQDVTVSGKTVLHITLEHKHCDAFEWLLRELKQMKQEHLLVNQTDQHGNTLLHLAVSMKLLQAVHALLRVVHVNATNSDGLTPFDLLHQSRYESGDDKVIKEILLGAGATRGRLRAIAQPQPRRRLNFNEALQRFILQIPMEIWPFIFLIVGILIQFVFQVATNSATIFKLEHSTRTSVSGHPAYHIKEVILGHDGSSRVFYLMTLLTFVMIVATLLTNIFLFKIPMGRFLVVALFALLISYGIIIATSMPCFFVIIGTFHISISWLTWLAAIFLLLLVALAKHIVVLLARFALLFCIAMTRMFTDMGVVWNEIRGKVQGRGRPPNDTGNP